LVPQQFGALYGAGATRILFPATGTPRTQLATLPALFRTTTQSLAGLLPSK